MEKSLLNRIYNVLIILIIFCGIFLRAKYFFEFRWLWSDELALFDNINTITLPQVFLPLRYNQASPPLFLFFSKIVLEISKNFSVNYMASLRLIPFLASIISIFAFFDLSKKFLSNKVNILISNLLFCLNIHLIYFASDFKQYSSDVCTFIIILLSYFYIDFNKLSKMKLYLIGSIYMLSMFFSFTSLFAIGAVFIVIISKNLKKENISKFSVLILPSLIGFAGLYLTQNYLSSNNMLYSFWCDGFVYSLIPGMIFTLPSKVFSYYLSIPLSKTITIIILLLIAGIIKLLFTINKPKSQLMLLPIVAMLSSVALYIYPFFGRLSLYMFPLLILVIINLFEYNKRYVNILSVLIFILSVFFVFKYQNPFNATIANLRAPLQKSLSVCSKNDVVLMNIYDIATYDQYDKIFHFNRNHKYIDFTKKNIEDLESGQYCLINAIANEHPDLTDNETRKKYHTRIVNKLKNTEIIEVYNDGKENIFVKFKK